MPTIIWRAYPQLYFTCPQCGLECLEGNPIHCPHQRGEKAFYNPARDGRVHNWEEIKARCGEGNGDGKPSPKPIAKPERAPMTTDEIVAASCSHGT